MRKKSLPVEGFGWRKYENGVPIYRHKDPLVEVDSRDYILWRSLDNGSYPRLNRWMFLETAFCGFVSRGYGAPLATAYDFGEVIKLLQSGTLLSKTWVAGVDAAEQLEFIRLHLLGVWFGERTPFLISTSPSWDESVSRSLSDFKQL